MRRGAIVAVLLLLACAHRPPPPPPPAPPPPPPPPKGERLRFRAKVGDESHSKVRLTIEQELAAVQGDKHGASGKPVTLQFELGEEEKVDAVAPDGSMLVSARIVDAVGQASQGANQKTVDDMALAFDELRIQFKRQPRGDVTAIGLSGLRAPLEEPTARQVLNAIYGAQRGSLFPEGPVDVGATWKLSVPMAGSSGYEGEVHYDYTYARKAGTAAVIGCEGRLDASKAQGSATQRLTGKSASEYRFDNAAGRLLGSSVDQTTQVEAAVQGREALAVGVRQRMRVEWTLEAADKDKSP